MFPLLLMLPLWLQPEHGPTISLAFNLKTSLAVKEEQKTEITNSATGNVLGTDISNLKSLECFQQIYMSI